MVKQHNCGFCLFVANNEEQWDIEEERKMFNFLWLTLFMKTIVLLGKEIKILMLK